jgi:hypothetical protein
VISRDDAPIVFGGFATMSAGMVPLMQDRSRGRGCKRTGMDLR